MNEPKVATPPVSGVHAAPSFWSRLTSIPVPTLTFAGVLLYGVQRLGATIFYGKLGFSPDDVGMTYASGVLQAVLGVLLLALILAGLGMYSVTMQAQMNLVRLVLNVARRRPDAAEVLATDTVQLTELPRHIIQRRWQIIVIVFVVVVVAYPLVAAWFEGKAAASGKPVWQLPGTSWSAPPAVVHVNSKKSVLGDGDCLLWVGEGGGFVVFYDPVEHEGLRIPASSVEITTGGALSEVSNVPADCPSGSTAP